MSKKKPSEKLKEQISGIDIKIHNLNCKSNELDSRMQDSWGFEDNNRASKLWGRISHCDNQVKELQKKKTKLLKKLDQVSLTESAT